MTAGASESVSIDFNRDVRPILSENCFHCHGPDANTREADLRLDIEAEAKRDLGGYFALTPGKPADSTVWERVEHGDPDEVMPPPKSKRSLSESQKKTIRLWIESGAAYADHWAYVAPERPEVSEHTESPVDQFVLSRLKQEGLTASPRADKQTQIRRVSLDLIGLPPSPDEVAAFVEDDSPDAWEKVIDRLLASKRFGEHWARPWLDLARYADSNGFQADQLRDSWAYRDWVIDALNANMPFDQFTIEQLAGDLLPNATLEQKIATGFHRTVTCNVEAGVHPEENRTNQVVDRVNTTATVWLGSTMECAQCHDHKYDPFSTKEYYQLFAYFNNTPLEVQNPSGKGVSFDFYGPKMDLPMPAGEAKKKATLEEEIKTLKKERALVMEASAKDRAAWEAELLAASGEAPTWEVLEVANFSGSEGETCEQLDDGSLLVKGEVPNKTTYTVKLRTKLAGLRAIKLEMLTHESLPANGPARGNGTRPNAIITEAELIEGKDQTITLHSARAGFSQTGWDVAGAIDGDPETGWAINPKFGEDHWAIFETEKLVGDPDSETGLTLKLEQNYGGGRVVGRLRLSATSDKPGAEDTDPELLTLLGIPLKKRSKKDLAKIESFWAKANPALINLDQTMAATQKKLKAIDTPSTLVMIEMDEPRETHVMTRGEYLNKAEKVDSGTPAMLHPLDPELPPSRLGLAKWLVDPTNPLVARVTVNRWWARIFGHGIVGTSEDFGTQSDPPTHPELLDWLAIEFMESGWDMKHTLKQIVLSDTYRQDSRLTDQLAKRDPDNRLYARGPRFRLSAEAIRDSGLTVAGLISDKMHGPPIMPYQPPDIWRQVGRNEPVWKAAEDENRYRRGLYIVWRRAAPYPSFVNFDGPDRSACVVDRPRTNTPLQALTLLNDPAYVEMAVALADRILREKPEADTDARLAHAFEIVLNRQPVDAEVNALSSLLESRLSLYQRDGEKAKSLINDARGWFQPSEENNTAELAAWFFIANTLLNLDETVTKG